MEKFGHICPAVLNDTNDYFDCCSELIFHIRNIHILQWVSNDFFVADYCTMFAWLFNQTSRCFWRRYFVKNWSCRVTLMILKSVQRTLLDSYLRLSEQRNYYDTLFCFNSTLLLRFISFWAINWKQVVFQKNEKICKIMLSVNKVFCQLSFMPLNL